MDSGEIEAVLEHPGRSPVRVCAFSPDSVHLVSGGSDGTLALWDFTKRSLLRTCAVSDNTLVACSFSPCGQLFVSGSSYGDLRVWNLELRQLHAAKDAHDLGVSCCQFAPQMQRGSGSDVMEYRLASCGQDSLLKIWILSYTPSTGCKMRLHSTLTGQTAPVLSCSFSADGQLLVSGSVDKSITVYEASHGTLLYTLRQHERYVTACAFSPTLPLMATGSMDKSVNLWRVEDGHSTKGACTHTTWWDEATSSDGDKEGEKTTGYSTLMPSDWSEDDVSSWLRDQGLEALVDVFKTNNIDGQELIALNKDTLSTELKIESVGLRAKLVRKIEELKMESTCTGVPNEYLCPITQELMKDPVIAADGYSYEREAIESWIRTKNRSSPMTNLPLQTTLLTPNHTLKMAISRWKTSL
ncbi:WD repeat, SAM and U-box domain-containing protein 1 isoform X2 [Engraulis encrasicolus]